MSNKPASAFSAIKLQKKHITLVLLILVLYFYPIPLSILGNNTDPAMILGLPWWYWGVTVVFAMMYGLIWILARDLEAHANEASSGGE